MASDEKSKRIGAIASDTAANTPEAGDEVTEDFKDFLVAEQKRESFQKRSAAEDSQFVNQSMRDHLTAQLLQKDSELCAERKRNADLTERLLTSQSSLEHLSGQSFFKRSLSAVVVCTNGLGGVLVSCADKSDMTKVFWGIPQPLWFAGGVASIIFGLLIGSLLASRG